jgi:hypothetical protein
MGERRLRMLEEQLHDDAAILGVDEHTAVVLLQAAAACLLLAIVDDLPSNAIEGWRV